MLNTSTLSPLERLGNDVNHFDGDNDGAFSSLARTFGEGFVDSFPACTVLVFFSW